jgi:hypothetical protein
MRLLTDPQPAIEWFCTGGSVCIGVEEQLRDVETAPEPRIRTAPKTKRPVRFPAGRGNA